MPENTELLKQIDTNTEMALLQGQKTSESLSDMNFALEGILMKADKTTVLLESAVARLEELLQKMGNPTDATNQEVIALLKEALEENKKPIEVIVDLKLI